MRRFILSALIFLSACSARGPASFFDQTPTPFNLGLSSTPEEIQKAMLESAVHWTTLQLSGVTTWYLADGSTQTSREQIWIDPLNDRYRVEFSGGLDNGERWLKLSDGKTITNVNYPANQVEQLLFPDFARVGQYIPPLVDGAAYPNPYWGLIGTPLSEIIFSSNFAQNKGVFVPLSIETFAGRTALVASWTYIENSQPSWQVWLDSQTGVILKMQEFGKDGGSTFQSERVIESIVYDLPFDESTFALPADMPIVAVPTRAESNPVVTQSAQTSEDEAGELYFFLQPRQAGQSIQLVKISGVCIYDAANCPALEPISVPFAFIFTINALSWSPDGNLAAFAYSDQPNGTPTKLWLFDANAKKWKSIAQFPFIDPPFWSPDGAWIAFRTQDGVGGEDVQVIRPDGTQLKSVSASLPLEGRPYIMDGWFGNDIIMRSALIVGSGSLYLVQPQDGLARPMFSIELAKAQFIASPNAALLAYDDYNESTRIHSLRVVEANGENSIAVAEMNGGSIYPIVWSPDGNLLAFNYYGDGSGNAQVYIVSRLGGTPSLIYEGSTVGRLIFSPNGRFLLIEETTSASGGHLYAADLATLDLNILQAPGLSTDFDWYAPSWRP